MRSSLIIAVLLALASPARAEDIAAYETEGDAPIGGADPRVAALDEAFARAVTLALNDVVAPDVRAARRADLDREIVNRARLWVAKFTVTKDRTADDLRQLEVVVRVDRDKLRGKLAELGIATMTVREAARGRAATILLRVTDPAGVRASYGPSAEQDLPGLGALASALRAAGLGTTRAPASGPEVRPEGELPVGDAEAGSLAADARAELAAIAGVTVGVPVLVRGLPTAGVLVTAHLRLLERRGQRPVGQGTASTAARGTEPSVVVSAIDRALVGAALDALPRPRATLTPAQGFQGDDTPVSEPGVVLVRLAPRTPWGLVQAEQKFLAGARGVQRATLRRLSPNGWVIGVTTTEPVERIAQIARRAPATDTAVKVVVSGEIVDVTLTGAP